MPQHKGFSLFKKNNKKLIRHIWDARYYWQAISKLHICISLTFLPKGQANKMIL